ncbi:TauD/TfdA family dioxygenase [Micromonospora eburnea]|uniref:Taurine dioxygenase, alpha-ketoglutarate-dependent n=1 Tax=Micromonospora eburnea TaxID=227316 RepID=A0A1C6UQP3_9ACTN|nr:TauD/TfdA family dioxygenase [Micromonospora eburnea]SCL56338.1 Taurine dioxygenase, alpha-ketoglutarate-dependent [Micromonospora eburnea]
MRLLAAGCVAEIDAGRVPSALARDGLVFIRQGSVDGVRELLDQWTEPVSHPHQSTDGLTVIVPRQRAVDGENEAGFSAAALSAHTDRSLVARPPSVLATVMVVPALTGGESVLVDGARVLALLRNEFDDGVIAGLRLRPRGGGDGQPLIELRGGLARFRYRDDQIGNPSSVSGREDVVAALRRLIAATRRSFRLAAGDGYLVHNHRVLHGRTAFSGSRRLVRLLAEVDGGHPYAWLNRGFRLADS